MAPSAEGSGHLTVPRWVQLGALPAVLLIGWLLFGKVGDAVFIFLVASFVALVLNPIVVLLRRIHIPRPIGVFIVYAAFVGLLVLVGFFAVPPLVRQFRALLDSIPGWIDSASGGILRLQNVADRLHLGIDLRTSVVDFAKSLSGEIPNASRLLVRAGISVAHTVTLTVIIVVTSIYMLLDGRRIGEFIARHFPTRSHKDGHEFNDSLQRAIGDYVKAQTLISLALGLTVGVAMWLLSLVGVFPSGADYALLFGAWTAVMEVIPYLGPVLAAAPPIFVALFHSPLTAVWVLVTFIVIQQLEGHILVPLLMGSRFKVHPLLVIFAILAGNQIHGIIGMLLAVPLIPIVKAVLEFLAPRVRFAPWKGGGIELLADDGEPSERSPADAGA